MGNPSIAISGANGFVGQALVAHCVGLGWNVLALARTAPINPSLGATYFTVGDLSKETLPSETFKNIDVLVHTAARVHVMDDKAADPLAAFRSVNTSATLRLARQAALAGVKRFVFLSSVKVNGETTQDGAPFTEQDTPQPCDPYALSKAEAETELRRVAVETGLEVVIVRPPLVYGPGVKANFGSLLQAVKSHRPLPLGAIHNKRSLVGLDNLVDLVALCCQHPAAANETFLASDGQDISTPGLVRLIAVAFGVKPLLIPLPVRILHLLGWCTGKHAAVQRLCGNLQISTEKTQRLLGWVPPFSIQAGLIRAVQTPHKP